MHIVQAKQDNQIEQEGIKHRPYKMQRKLPLIKKKNYFFALGIKKENPNRNENIAW